MTNNALIQKAIEVINPRTIDNADMGGVACALLSGDDRIFQGVCIDTISGMGFCAEHTAVSQMITQGTSRIKKVVAVKKDASGCYSILPPCGRCREFMYQIDNRNTETEVILKENTIVLLKDLLPYYNGEEMIELN